MAIFFVVGKPGGGKSYYGVKQMVEECLRSDRYVVTNIELLLPELRQLLQDEQKSEYTFETAGEEVAVPELTDRVRVLDDDESGEFWRYEPGRDFDERRTVKRGGKTFEVPDFQDRAKRGCLYVIDEVHVLFGAREWQNTGGDCTFFSRNIASCVATLFLSRSILTRSTRLCAGWLKITFKCEICHVSRFSVFVLARFSVGLDQ